MPAAYVITVCFTGVWMKWRCSSTGIMSLTAEAINIPSPVPPVCISNEKNPVSPYTDGIFVAMVQAVRYSIPAGTSPIMTVSPISTVVSTDV